MRSVCLLSALVFMMYSSRFLAKNVKRQGFVLVVTTPQNFGGRVGREARELMCSICKSGFPAQVFVRDEVDLRGLGPSPCPAVTITAMPSIRESQKAELWTTRDHNTSTRLPRHVKVAGISMCPFAETIYLDNDISFPNADPLFAFFGQMRAANRLIAARVNEGERRCSPSRHYLPEVPETFCERNGGVLLMRCDSGAKQIMQTWVRHFEELEKDPAYDGRDQMPLRRTLYAHRGQLMDLPTEFNCRAHRDKDNPDCLVLHAHSETKMDIPCDFHP